MDRLRDGRWIGWHAGVLLTAAFTVAIMLSPAAAQQRFPGGVFPLYYLDIRPEQFVASALAEPHGQALVNELAAVLSESADPRCLVSRGITKAALPAHARTILRKRGTHLLQTYLTTVDRTAYKRFLPARLGKRGPAEFARLARRPAVAAYISRETPLRHAGVLNLIAENITRMALIHRIRLVRGIGPIDNGAVAKADPSEGLESVLTTIAAADTTGDVSRYLDMRRVAQKVFDDTVDMEKLKSYGPSQLLKGIDGDFAALCIPGATPRP